MGHDRISASLRPVAFISANTVAACSCLYSFSWATKGLAKQLRALPQRIKVSSIEPLQRVEVERPIQHSLSVRLREPHDLPTDEEEGFARIGKPYVFGCDIIVTGDAMPELCHVVHDAIEIKSISQTDIVVCKHFKLAAVAAFSIQSVACLDQIVTINAVEREQHRQRYRHAQQAELSDSTR